MRSFLGVNKVTKKYGKLVAVYEVSIEVEQGSIHAIIGPNGAGKTTLFHMLSGHTPLSQGSISFQGKDITRLPVADRARMGIVRTFQITEIFPEMTTYQTLLFGIETAMGLNHKLWTTLQQRVAADQRVHEMLEIGRLTPLASHLVGDLAHGDQRIVEIVLAACMQPSLLLLDEPTAGMGNEETHYTVDLIRRLREEQGLTIVFVEHDMELVFDIADRITVLDQGQKIAEGTPSAIADNEAVQRAYLGEEAH